MKHTIRRFKRDKLGFVVEEVKSVKCELGTGMLDRGGAEIIEGDIVIFENKEYPVVFHDCEFYLHEAAGDLPLSTFESYELEILGHVDEEDNHETY